MSQNHRKLQVSMESTAFNGYSQPHPSFQQGDLSLEDTIVQLKFFSLSQILALRRSLLRHEEHEIENTFFEHRVRPCSSTSTCPPGSHLSFQSGSTPSWYIDQNSVTSSRNSHLSIASSATNFSRPYSQRTGHSSMNTPSIDDSYGQFGPDFAQNQTQSPADPLLTTYSPALDLTSPSAPMNALTAPMAQQEAGATVIFRSQMGPPLAKSNVKPIPCPEPYCSHMYSEIGHLLEHVTSQHDQDIEFVCTHQNCGNIAYSDKSANRHHTNHHNTCPQKGVDCRQKQVLRNRKYWGCDVCARPPFSSAKKWAEHYHRHFSKKSETFTNGVLDHPKNRVRLTWRILSLLKQQATDVFWNERDQMLPKTPGVVWQYAWDESEDALGEILTGLQYGTFRDESMEKEEVARQLVDEVFELSSNTCYSAEYGYLQIPKRQASMSPNTLRFLYDQDTPSSLDLVAERQVQVRRQTSADILDNFSTLSGCLNRE